MVNMQKSNVKLISPENYKMLMKEMKSYLTTWTGVLYSWTGYSQQSQNDSFTKWLFGY